MAIEYTQTVTSAGITDWVRVDSTGRAGANYLVVIDLEENGGSTVDLEFAVQKDLSVATPIQHHILKNITESTASTLHIPVTAFRLNVLSYGSGNVTFRAVQHED
jgi:hypothetical protein